MTIDVTAVNDAPTVANAIGARSVAAGSNLAVALETDGSEVFNDVDGDTLTYSATSATETAATVTVDNDANTITLSGVAAGTSVITVTASDGNGGSVSDTFTLTVTSDPGPTNTPPTASDNTVTTDEDTAYTFDAADFNFSDVDSGDTLSSVKITGLETAGALQLSGADVTREQVITAANIDADNLTFTPAANANGDPYATFRFSVNDGEADSTSSYTMTIDVTAVNDAPTVANAIGARSVAAGSNLAVALETDGSEVFNDVDGDTLTYSATSATETAATVTVDNDANTITLSGVAAGTSVITVTASDGNGGSVSDTFTLTVTSDPGPTNTPPTASDNTVTTDEDTAYTFDAADFNFSDVDSGDTLASVKITGLETAGALQLSGADVTQDQVITAANIDADNLVFTPAANANGDPYATFRFSVNDGTDDSTASYTMTIDVTAVNDAPTVANAIGARSVAAGSNLTVALETDGSEVFNDVDGDTLTYSATSATETAATVTVDNDANTITLSGVAAGTSVITVTASDGNGGSVSDTFTLTVTSGPGPTNTPPTASDNTVTTDEDTAYTFDAADFNFSDVDSGDTLSSVKITGLETAGALQLSGADVTQDQVITTANIDADNLTFTPAANANGDPYATFRFSVNDGTDDSAASYTMTIDVTPVNDAPTVANAIPDQIAIVDNAFSYAFPANTFADVDNDTLTYTAQQSDGTALPTWLSFTAATRTFSGTPQAADEGTLSVQVTANDGNNSQISDTFDITVVGTPDAPTFGTRTVANQSYVQNTAIATLTLPQAVGGDAPLTYSLSPDAPDGLVFSAANRTLTGTPSGTQLATAYTYRVTDADGDSAVLSFNITITADTGGGGGGGGSVDRTPTFNGRAIADQTYKQNVSIDDLTLPSARSGDGSLSYTLSPDLPAGLSFDAATRRISGTPTEALAQTEYTYTATDRDGDTATLTFNITVEAEVVDLMPSFGDETIADQDFTQNTAIDTLTLPLATGGDGALSYSIEPALPAGLMLDEDTRTISGTPTVAQAAASYTWTATDVDGDTASLSFNIRVAAVLTLSGVADADTAENTEYSAAATLEGTPVGDVNWSLSGADAALFSLSNESNDGVTVSLPAQDFENAADADADNTYEYTLTATDADGNGVGVEVAVRVTDEADTATVPSAPAAPTLEAGDQRIAVTWSAPADDGGSAITGYTVQWKAGDGAWPEPGPMDSVELGASSTSFNIDGLSNGTTYEVRVLASNAVGDGAWSDAARATPMAVTDASRLYRDLNEAILPRLGQTILDGSITAVRNRLDLVGQPLPAQQSSFVANLGSYRFNNSAESIGAGGLRAEGQYGRLSGPLGAGGTLSNAGLPSRESMQAGGVSEPGFGGRGVGGGFASVGMNGANGAGGMAQAGGISAMSSSGGGMSGVLGGMGMGSMGHMGSMDSGMNGRGGAGGMGATDVMRLMLSRTLGNSAFSLQQGTAAGNTWGFWGAGSYDNLSGSGAGLSWDGDLYGARLGVDVQIQDCLLLGVALQYSQGAIDWNGTASGSGLSHGGQYDIEMPGIHPYIGWVSSDRAWQLWAMAGYDEGQIEIHEQGGLTGRQESDVDMLSLAGGIGRELWSAGSVSDGGQYSLRGRAEVAGLQMDLAGNQAIGSSFTGAMESMTLSSHRLRAGLEASHARVVGNGNMLDLSLEAGLRSDGDDSQDDTAVELGIGIGWRGTNGLTLDGRARVLTASDIDSEEWGVDLQLHFDPGQPNVGMNLDVSTVYGAADMLNIGAPAQGGMGGAAGIFGAAANMGQLGYSQWRRPQLRFESNMGYGFETRSGLLTPYWGMAASGAEERHYRVGARWEISYSARLLLEVQYDASDRSEFSSPNGDRTPRSRIMLEFHVSF
ncbi:putative Ig domain-containing protein [Candidatus Foliamicus sp.]